MRTGAAGRLTKRRIVAVVTGALCVSASACSSSGSPTSGSLRALDDNGNAGMTGGNIKLATPYVFPLPPVCTTGATATVTQVQLTGVKGAMRLADWGIRHRYPGDPYSSVADNTGGDPGLVTAVHGYSEHQAVSVRCVRGGNTREVDEFAVAVALSGQRATIKGVEITYRSGGSQHTVHNRFAITLCTARTCKDN